jgi:hypothetical protein
MRSTKGISLKKIDFLNSSQSHFTRYIISAILYAVSIWRNGTIAEKVQESDV